MSRSNVTSEALRVRRPSAVALHAALFVLWVWDIGAIAFSPYASAAVRTALAVLFALAIPGAWLWWRGRGVPSTTLALRAVALCALPLAAWLVLLRPSNDRVWAVDQERLPRATIDAGRVTLHDVRNFRYRSASDFDPAWETRTYDLDELDSAWFIVEPFSSFPGAAHTFLSFGFEGGEYVAVSVEIRRERGESFSASKGLYRNYEIMYVFGDERDLVELRTEHRHDTVYVYPVRATKELVRAMFVDILERANTLAAQPEFYNSVTNTCTTNIAHHANRIRSGIVPYSWQLLLPGHADGRALELGLIDFDGTLEAARARFRVNERAGRAAGNADFSARIREP